MGRDYKGQLYLDIKIAQAFRIGFDALILKGQIERLTAGLDEAQMILSRSYDDKGDIEKTCFTLSAEKQLGKNLEQLRSRRGELYNLVNSLNLLRREKETVILTCKCILPSVEDKRKESKPEVIFVIPAEYSKPQTLRSFLDGHGGRDADDYKISKTDRLNFAHRISAAFSKAQEAGLIHKDVRLVSILVFKERGAQGDSSRRGKA